MPDTIAKPKKYTSFTVYPRTKDEYDALENTIADINRDENLFKKITRSDFVMDAVMEKIQSMPQPEQKVAA